MMHMYLINFTKKYKTQLLIAAAFLICYFLFAFAERHYFTYDTVFSQSKWWDYLLKNGWHGIATLNTMSGGDYTTIWYFMIVIFTKLQIYPHFPIEYCLKAIAIVCSLLSALAMFFIAKHFQPKSKYLPTIVAGVTLFLPLFSMDLLKTNLTDGMYILPSLWSFYFLLKNKKALSWFLLAIGACFKLMAIYLVPVYIFFYIKDFKTYKLREKLTPLWSLLGLALCSIPNVLAGGNFIDGIITPIIGRNNAAVVMPWFWLIPPSNNLTPSETAHEVSLMLYGLLFLVLFMTIFFILKYIKKTEQKRVGLAILPTLSILACFFLLPSQHETYFAMAAIFSLIGFLAFPTKAMFVNFLAINIFLFYMYIFGLTWWYEKPVWILPNAQMGIIFLGIIIFNYYLVYKKSIFYHPPRIGRAR